MPRQHQRRENEEQHTFSQIYLLVAAVYFNMQNLRQSANNPGMFTFLSGLFSIAFFADFFLELTGMRQRVQQRIDELWEQCMALWNSAFGSANHNATTNNTNTTSSNAATITSATLAALRNFDSLSMITETPYTSGFTLLFSIFQELNWPIITQMRSRWDDFQPYVQSLVVPQQTRVTAITQTIPPEYPLLTPEEQTDETKENKTDDNSTNLCREIIPYKPPFYFFNGDNLTSPTSSASMQNGPSS